MTALDDELSALRLHSLSPSQTRNASAPAAAATISQVTKTSIRTPLEKSRPTWPREGLRYAKPGGCADGARRLSRAAGTMAA